MIVMKFGGTSVGTPETINTVREIVKARLPERPVVVASAHSGVTNILFGLAHDAVRGRHDTFDLRQTHYEIIDALGLERGVIQHDLDELEELLKGISYVKELTPRSLDYVVSFGEKFSTKVIAAYFSRTGLPAVAVNAYDLGLLTDSNFGGANPLPKSDPIIAQNIAKFTDVTPIITGYIAKDENGDITTLGRSGSDYSASVIGAAIDAKEIQIWTDVDGVMTADPNLVPGAETVASLSFEEASELAYYGARVIHPSTMVPAIKKDIPVRVLNTYKPDHPGTVILRECAPTAATVKSIAHKKGVTLITVVSTRMLLQHGFMAKLFETLNRHRIVIDMIATSEVSVSMTTDTKHHLRSAVKELSEYAQVTVEENKSIVCVVGDGIRRDTAAPGKVFGALATAGINVHMISQGATKINIAFLVDNADAERTVKVLHNTFFGNETDHATTNTGRKLADDSAN
jgi:aspartate kinase